MLMVRIGAEMRVADDQVLLYDLLKPPELTSTKDFRLRERKLEHRGGGAMENLNALNTE